MRQITPHKGGRSKRFYGRCTPLIKNLSNEIKQKTGESDADIYEQAIINRHNEIFNSSLPNRADVPAQKSQK